MPDQCPSCGFAGSSILPTGQRRCASCGYVWTAAFSYPRQPFSRGPAGAPRPVRHSTWGKSIFIMVVVAAVILPLAWLGAQNRKSKEAERAERKMQEREARAPKTGPLPIVNAAIGANEGHGKNSISAWWVVQYDNRGNRAIGFPRATMTITQDSETIIRQGISRVHSLPPGESTYLLITAPAAYYGGKTKVEVTDPKEAYSSQPTFFRLEVYDLESVKPERSAYTYAVGTLKNPTRRQVQVQSVNLVGFDENGDICAYAMATADAEHLAPQGTTKFKVTAGAWESSVPVLWHVDAWGSYSK